MQHSSGMRDDITERNASFMLNRSANHSWTDFPERSDLMSDGSAVLRILISTIYSVVCALGLVGNLLVLHLMKSKHAWKKSSINLFVTGLAVTDFQFVLTLPFWAVENALDFTWPFGRAMCKIVSYVTATSMYASVFFLTAMSVARYHSVASALKSGRRRKRPSACCISAVIWTAAVVAALPHAIFSTTATVSNEDLCLVKFPDPNGDAQFWLGLYHAQKVLLGFLVPFGIISMCYLLLLRFVTHKRANASSARRRSKVTKSVTIVVLCFFLCWLPNQALTTWGILIKLNAVHFSYEYYTAQVYVFPVTVCLAHSNSCLNPLLYCLMRREFRKALKELFWKIASPSSTNTRPFTACSKPEDVKQKRSVVPLSTPDPGLVFYPPGVVVYNRRNDLLPNST
ncbi:relaxin-3 receptor 1 [Ictalurus punctatus]|uniref:Relaxin-3 receptor 1 n=1 Tax=Ictalurus punctatus TaxID=7998 RepID=A0A2D0SXX0_ICTPU|nr:relaxin-3 receptor 1 [Ictalurus punctatus]XP_053505566.1 relaxin-3 receptor 1 [Ictalurus furcatus]